MKQNKFIYIILITVILILTSCGSKGYVSSQDSISKTLFPTQSQIPVSKEPEDVLDDLQKKDKIDVSITPNEDILASADPYVGVYNNPSIDEPNLKIEKDEDGSYSIQIGLYRLAKLNECKGILKDNKLEFSTNEIFDDELKGEIVLNGDIAEVSFFGSEWLDFAGFNYQEFEKISDIPYDIY